jgi:hypothetical protein
VRPSHFKKHIQFFPINFLAHIRNFNDNAQAAKWKEIVVSCNYVALYIPVFELSFQRSP